MFWSRLPAPRARTRFAPLLAGAMLLLPVVRPAAAQQAAPPTAAPAGATSGAAEAPPPRPRRASWTADRREYAVGDVITVLLDESTLASATKDQRGTDRQERNMDLGVELPTGGVSLAPKAAGIGTGKRTSSDQSGIARRNLRFLSEMSVRVVEVGAGGLLQVKGTRLVDLDQNRQEFSFSGWVRPEDVSRDNVVASTRVADAELIYAGKGKLGGTRGGIIGRIVGMVWP